MRVFVIRVMDHKTISVAPEYGVLQRNVVQLQGVPDDMKNANAFKEYLINLQTKRAKMLIINCQPMNENNAFAHILANILDIDAFKSLNEIAQDYIDKYVEYCPSVEEIRPKMRVFIIHVVNYQTFFVIPCSSAQRHADLIHRVEIYAKTAPQLKNPPKIGHILLAKPKYSNGYARCIIEKITSSEADVEFLEYGLNETVNINEMKSLSKDLVDEPRLINKVSLMTPLANLDLAPKMERFLQDFQIKNTKIVINNLEKISNSNSAVHFLASFEADSELLPTGSSELIKRKIFGVKTFWFEGLLMKVHVLNTDRLNEGIFHAIRVRDYRRFCDLDESINQYGTFASLQPHYCPR